MPLLSYRRTVGKLSNVLDVKQVGTRNGYSRRESYDGDKKIRQNRSFGVTYLAIFVMAITLPALKVQQKVGIQLHPNWIADNASFGFLRRQRQYPRSLLCLYEPVDESHTTAIISRLDPNDVPRRTKRRYTQDLQPKKIHAGEQPDEFETESCRAQHEWQLRSFPTCNALHELNLRGLGKHPSTRLLAHGFYRDVWSVKDGSRNRVAVKTLRLTHDFSPRDYDLHRKDALAMERLTEYPFVANIYGSCGNSGMFEYGADGDMKSAIKENNLTKLDKLHMATQAAMGLAALHNFDQEGRASIAHTDVKPAQFIYINGVYKLNDFNRAVLIPWNRKEDKPCSYSIGWNKGYYRSPEEYRYKSQSEKVDVFQLGNVFYTLLRGKSPFYKEEDEEKVFQKVINGEQPHLSSSIRNSEDPIDKAILEAMDMCFIYNPKKRATAREVETHLINALDAIDPGAKERWTNAA